MSRHKDKYEPSNPRRSHTFMPLEEVNAGKKSQWMELEITGNDIHMADIFASQSVDSFPFQVLYETSVPTCGSCSIWRLSIWTTTTWLESHQRSAASHASSNWTFLATSFVTCHLRLGSWWPSASSYCTTTTSGPFLWRWVNSSSCRYWAWRAIRSLRISWPCSARSTGLTKFCPTFWTIYPVSPHITYNTLSAISLSFLPGPAVLVVPPPPKLSNHDSSPLDLNNGWLILRASVVVWRHSRPRRNLNRFEEKWDQEPSDMVAPQQRQRKTRRLIIIGSDSTFQFLSNPNFSFESSHADVRWLLPNMRIFIFTRFFLPSSRWVCESIGGC